MQQKKNELDKIFSSSNRDKGIRLILDFGLQEELELYNLNELLNVKINNSIGVWSLLNVEDIYPFSKNELDLIKGINRVLKSNNLDAFILYKYGLYVNSCAGEIKGIDIGKITDSYNKLVIKNRADIQITSDQIMEVLNREPGKYIKDIYEDIEKEIVDALHAEVRQRISC